MEQQHPPGETVTIDRTAEFRYYRLRRACKPIPAAAAEHLDGLWPAELDQLEEAAVLQDEQDAQVRHEISKYPHGYAWHKGPGGGLPLDWSDSELAELRP